MKGKPWSEFGWPNLRVGSNLVVGEGSDQAEDCGEFGRSFDAIAGIDSSTICYKSLLPKILNVVEEERDVAIGGIDR